jgi:predicted phage-related endonuclease
LELFYQLTGQLPRYTDEETQAQKIGSLIQDPIGYLAAEQLGLKIRKAGPRTHAQYPWMTANLDFDIVSNPKGPGALEIKNRGAAKPYDELPEDITVQVAHQLAVTRREWAVVAVLFGFGQLKTYEVQRDKELEEALIEIEARFILRVQQGQPPDQAWTPETVGLLKKLYPADSGKTIELPAEMAVNAEGFLEAKKEVEAAEERKAIYEGLLKSAMGDAAIASMPGYSLSWKSTKPSKRFDEEAFKAAHPDLYAQFEVTKPGYRRFLIKPGKEIVKHEAM